MTADLGQFTLILSLFLSSYAILAEQAGSLRNNIGLIRSARNAMFACFVSLSLAMAILWIAFYKCDFSLKYVADHASTTLPMGYRISALWAGAAGSLLLWLWMQVGFIIKVYRGVDKDIRIFNSNCRSIANLITVFFLIVLIFDKNPFELSQIIPKEGAGLNPLLQHPAMILHPPILFVGYAAFAVPFAWAFGSFKLKNKPQPLEISKIARNWTLLAWWFLTGGIALGAWWAYEELGWGGYWAWDPVENSSLMPWLTATALVHCFRIYKDKTAISVWTEILSVLTFSLCVFGTFLTRYGLVSSVHAFSDPGLGMLFIVLLIHIWVFALILIARKYWPGSGMPDITSSPAQKLFIWNNWLMLFLTFVILIGTLFPFLSGLVSERKISLKPEYFNKITAPAGIILLLFIAVCPHLWKFGFKRKIKAVIAAIVGAVAVFVWLILNELSLAIFIVSAYLLIALIYDFASLIKSATNKRNWRAYGARIVHLGIALMFIGIAGSGGYDHEDQFALKPGEQANIGKYKLVYNDIRADHGPNFTAMIADVAIFKDGELLTTLSPSKVVYSTSGKTLSEVDIRRTLLSDVYLALTNVDISQRMVNITVMVKPLINWIWIGCTLLAVGSLIVWIDLTITKK